MPRGDRNRSRASPSARSPGQAVTPEPRRACSSDGTGYHDVASHARIRACFSCLGGIPESLRIAGPSHHLDGRYVAFRAVVSNATGALVEKSLAGTVCRRGDGRAPVGARDRADGKVTGFVRSHARGDAARRLPSLQARGRRAANGVCVIARFALRARETRHVMARRTREFRHEGARYFAEHDIRLMTFGMEL